MTYSPPLRDLAFSLEHVAGASALRALYPGYDADTEAAVLDAAGRLARDVLAPLNRIGDEQGARFENGRVFAAPGFPAAYKAFAEGGWNALSADPEFGGQGLPKALEIATFEMFDAANMAFGLCPILTQGAIEALTAHGIRPQQQLYLPKLISGEWTGTMNLTEPQAGSDLASLNTRAETDADGSYSPHRPEDLHHLGRSRLRGEHRPSRAGAPSRRAAGHQRHVAVRGAEASRECGGISGRGQCAAARRHRAQARHPRLAHLHDAFRRRARGAGRRSEPRLWRTCSR